MQKHYEKIGKQLEVTPEAVHLVHYVMSEMPGTCVFPPDLNDSGQSFYSPVNVCSALLAYLRFQHGDEVQETLDQFGIRSSEQVGKIVEALQNTWSTRVVRRLKVEPSKYSGLFSLDESSDHLRHVRWVPQEIEDLFPEIKETRTILHRHFGGADLDELVVGKRSFPAHVRADVQLALNEIFSRYNDVQLFGLSAGSAHEGLNFRTLISKGSYHNNAKIGPLTYDEVPIGEDENVPCQASGLWLTHFDGIPVAIVLGSQPYYQSGGGLLIEVASNDDENSRAFGEQFFEDLKNAVEASRCYRGKILSFESNDDYDGRTAAVKVHELKHVAKEEVILPEKTRELLDRNVIEFARQRAELSKRGMNLKKGLLFFGPPGTGKTHTVHYLSRALPETTTLIITSEQIGLLSHYMTLARLLQPSLVVIEDADLIARQREDMDTCEEVLLNKLLNEMDGLRADSEVIFVLTTNRPEALEAALTARPGRIDQAIEFPLPDESGRRKLARLYAGNQDVAESVVESAVQKTEHTSAAFIKELMRRATQYAISRGDKEAISTDDISIAIEEMLFSGNAFNRLILGASSG